MPIELTKFDYPDLCHGYKWEITDVNKLAHLIAVVAIGQYRHAYKILNVSNTTSHIPITDSIRQGATQLLEATTEKEQEHRDGWMFQVISWIAANLQTQDAIIQAPHMIRASKGFDGLQLCLNSQKEIEKVIIFEDKATIDPRGKINSQVWPEFSNIESGEKDNILMADCSELIEKQPNINHDEIMATIIWEDIKHYRVSVTIGDTHNEPIKHKDLFKGYDDITSHHGKRQAETIYLKDLRISMQDLADKVIEEIGKIV